MQETLIKLAPIIGIIALFISGAKVFLWLQRRRYTATVRHVLLSIRVSRLNEKLPIVAEQMFAVLHGIYHKLSWLDKLRGITTESFSFEIANVDGLIKFFVYVPVHLRYFVEGQIYAQYPDVEIQEVEDYLTPVPTAIHNPERINSEESSGIKDLIEVRHQLGPQAQFKTVDHFTRAVGVELVLKKPDIYPIKRHSQYEDKITRTAVDPLSGITSALMKLASPNDIAAVQVVVRPLGDRWRSKATKCGRILGKNIFFGIGSLQRFYARAFMTRKLWPKFVFFPFYWIMFFQGLMSSSKVSLSAQESGPAGDVIEENVSSQHERESDKTAIMDKVSKLPFDVSVRVLYVPALADPAVTKVKLRELAGAFKQFNQPNLNSFIVEESGHQVFERFHKRVIFKPFVFNIEELATVFHLPNVEVKTPNIYWVNSKKLEPPFDLPDPNKEKELTILGRSNYRGVDKLFGIRNDDRRRHIYIIGKTGMGKSTLLENMIISDIKEGKGVAVVDPHGDLADTILDNIPSNRTNDVVVFDPSDRDFPVAFNMLENIDPAMNSVVASGLVGIFKKLYAESWGPRLEHILRNTILSLLEYPNTTMLGIPRILSDKDFRRRVVSKITDPVVKKFWSTEFEPMQDKQRVEAISPIQNKVGQFLSSSIIRNIVGQPKSMVDLRFSMDKKKIFICNLSKGKIGEDNSSLLGSMIITKFQLDAMSRSNIPEKERVDFYLYVDEFQNFATDSFATILSEARKYRLNLTMANQYIAQMSEEVQEAVFGNVGTTIAFQVGFDDAEYIGKQFGEEVVLPNDLTQLPKYNVYAKLMVDGMPSQPFSAATLPPIGGAIEEGRREKVIRFSRERYAKPREIVEDKIRRWSEGGEEENTKDKGQSIKLEEKKELLRKQGPGFRGQGSENRRRDSQISPAVDSEQPVRRSPAERDESRKGEVPKLRQNRDPQISSEKKPENIQQPAVKSEQPVHHSSIERGEGQKSEVPQPLQEPKKPESGYVLPEIKPESERPPVDIQKKQ